MILNENDLKELREKSETDEAVHNSDKQDFQPEGHWKHDDESSSHVRHIKLRKEVSIKAV